MGSRSIEFVDLSGGLNTASDNELLADNEFADLRNVCMKVKGNLRRRNGITKLFEPEVAGNGQGFFRLTRKGREPVWVAAVNGKLYRPATDTIDLNEVLDYEYVSRTDDYTIIKLPLTNYKADSSVIFDKDNTEDFEQVTTIEAANQISIADKEMQISLSNITTGWSEEPNLTKMRTYFADKQIKITYEVNSTNIEIEGLEDGFQKTRKIEATQYKTFLYIATGTKLIVFDGGEKAKVVEPHKPSPLEALYIGTNALADDPNNFMSDGVAAELRVDGITSTMRVGCVNEETTFTAYVSKPETMADVEYKFQYRKAGAEEWTVIQDFGEAKEVKFTPDETGNFEIDAYAREKGKDGEDDPEPARFIVPKWEVTETNENELIDFSAIHRCNRIVLHWGRLIVYGDDYGTSMIYISHLNQPEYFPTPNSLSFENTEQEQITSLVKYRDMLVAFTPTSIQALYGKSPSDYSRVTLNTKVGCIAPFTAQVVDNYLVFLSHLGVYMMDSVTYTEDQGNVTKLDTKIDNIVYRDENAVAAVTGDQYKLYYPDRKLCYKTYYRQGWVWGIDESDLMDITYIDTVGNDLYLQRKSTGAVYYRDEERYDDDGHVYQSTIVTKEYDFGKPYTDKKLKQIKLLFTTYASRLSYYISLIADGNYIINPLVKKLEIIDGEVVYTEQEEPNVLTEQGTVLGTWKLSYDAFGTRQSSYFVKRVSGRFKRLRLIIVHKEAKPNSLISFGYNFIEGRQIRKIYGQDMRK